MEVRGHVARTWLVGGTICTISTPSGRTRPIPTTGARNPVNLRSSVALSIRLLGSLFEQLEHFKLVLQSPADLKCCNDITHVLDGLKVKLRQASERIRPSSDGKTPAGLQQPPLIENEPKQIAQLQDHTWRDCLFKYPTQTQPHPSPDLESHREGASFDLEST